MVKLKITTLFLAVLLSGCTHYIYVANVQNLPLFKEKNEYRFSGTYGEGNASSCIEIQAAYSITHKIGILTNFMSAKGGDYSENGRENYFEGAIGYYKPVRRSGVFEIYGGLGRGYQHRLYGTNAEDFSYMKIFIQPSFGLTYNVIDIIASTRIYGLSYYTKSRLNLEYDPLYNKTHLFFEPALTVRGGWKHVKMQFQAALPIYSNNNHNSPFYFSEKYHISIGLLVAIAKRYRKGVLKIN